MNLRGGCLLLTKSPSPLQIGIHQLLRSTMVEAQYHETVVSGSPARLLCMYLDRSPHLKWHVVTMFALPTRLRVT